jgi:hypothetical protein
VWQEGTDNAVNIWQKLGSYDNSASVNQGQNTFTSTDEISCPFRCQFATASNASITQSGGFNGAGITQYAQQSRAIVEQQGTGTSLLRNIARITQFEAANSDAIVLQTVEVGPSGPNDPSSGALGDPNYFPGGMRSAEARIRQRGGTLSARIEQRGRGQQAAIEQSGSANLASILQDFGATNATAIIAQSGSGNSYSVVQTMPGQYINVSQTGTNNSVTNVVSRP